MIFQPSGNLRKISVKRPCGVLPSDIVSCHDSADERGVWAEHLYSQIGKIQLAHFVAGTRVRRLVAVDRGLPAFGLFRARKEGQVGRIPVARHEGVEIVAIPGVLLSVEDLLDGGLRLWIGGLATRRGWR